jgi:hypothetical protein
MPVTTKTGGGVGGVMSSTWVQLIVFCPAILSPWKEKPVWF